MLDTHCHIDLYKKPKEILEFCEKNKTTIISMTNLPSHFEMGLPFFYQKKYVRMSLGMHPLYAELHNSEFHLFEKYLCQTSYIGEVGLDFSKAGINSKEIQLKSFTKILELVSGQKKLLSIHSRKAENEVLENLINYRIKNAIFHWYSGEINLVKRIVQEGYYFSINLAMIKSASGQKIISKIPKNNILTETDGPFIGRGNIPLMPGEVEDVLLYLSKIWNVSFEQAKEIIRNNFKNLINSL